VVVIGAGFGGIGMAIALKQAGIEDFVVVDRAADLGGTWRDNSYPGLACDVPSHLYSFSFRPWRWSRRFPPREEILAYLQALVAERALILRMLEEGQELPAGCILLSPWLDLGPDRRAVLDLVRRDVLLDPDWLDACARAYADPSAWADPLVSPLGAAHVGLPPLLIQAATEELLAPDAELLAASASAGGVDVTYTRWPRMWHDFALQPGLLTAADSALAQASWFVRKVTASPGSGS
jgi:hypothetical protein